MKKWLSLFFVFLFVNNYLNVAYAVKFSSNVSAKRSQYNYIMFCQGCHGENGIGRPGNVPRINGFIGNFLRVKGGREFLVQVPGSAFSPLNDAELAELLNWMLINLSANETPEKFKRYNADEVRALRANALTDVDNIRNKLLESMKLEHIDIAENAVVK